MTDRSQLNLIRAPVEREQSLPEQSLPLTPSQKNWQPERRGTLLRRRQFPRKPVGQSYVGKILVLDTAKGGVATAWMLHEMKSRGIVPLALVFNSVNPILAQGAALGDVSMLAGFDEDITAAVPNGAEVEVNPEMGVLTVVG
jgi:predicted aconitase with swiveling domain